ncbi:MAG TPA: DUF2796 domain-containing protein [Dokdonella sp.]
MHRALPLFALLVSFAALAAAPASPHRHHGPHVHGEATLNVGLDGQLLLVSLDAPGMSLLGFEHPPRDDAERAAYRATLDALNAPGGWLLLPQAAGCALESVQVAPHGFDAADGDGHGDDDHDHDDDAHGGDHEHADFDATYRYACHAPLALHALDVTLFERFPPLHKVNVDLVLPDRQGSQVLTPGTTMVPLSK